LVHPHRQEELEDLLNRVWAMSTAAIIRSRSGSSRSTLASASRNGSTSNAVLKVASIRASLLPKARKIVPSATPAASAICRVLTSTPYFSSRGKVAWTSAARRSSGGNGVARGLTRSRLTE
jgi:hypothetical protein